jgi:hypothetical protein
MSHVLSMEGSNLYPNRERCTCYSLSKYGTPGKTCIPLSLGTKPSSDAPLFSGYKTFIGTREVQLDASVPKSQIPVIHGAEMDDRDCIDPGVQLVSPRKTWPLVITDPAQVPKQNLGPATVMPLTPIAPASFYGKAPQKPRNGPLYVLNLNTFQVHISQSI